MTITTERNLIVKAFPNDTLPADPRLRAGVQAEKQLAFYLHRAFAEDKSVFVFHGLRLVDPLQPEASGVPGVCQIDHLILHRSGLIIIESKSIAGTVTVSPDGSGGDEWVRDSWGRRQAIPSPLQQAKRQGEFLRNVLNRAHLTLLDRVSAGLRLVARIVAGSDQKTFAGFPVQVIVAVSDGATVIRQKDWQPPEKPVQHYVCKADQVVDKVRVELERHKQAVPLYQERDGDYGIHNLSDTELERITRFLLASDQPASISHERSVAVEQRCAPTPSARAGSTSAPPAQAPLPAQPTVAARAPVPASPAVAPSPLAPPIPPPGPFDRQPTAAGAPASRRINQSCKHCGGASLTGRFGKYGYYWVCDACEKNTPMLAPCSGCGAVGHHGKGVRVRKDGARYYRDCEKCSVSELIWVE